MVTANADGVGVNVAPDQVAVVLNREFLQLPSQEQLLILGQVVLTRDDAGSDGDLRRRQRQPDRCAAQRSAHQRTGVGDRL